MQEHFNLWRYSLDKVALNEKYLFEQIKPSENDLRIAQNGLHHLDPNRPLEVEVLFAMAVSGDQQMQVVYIKAGDLVSLPMSDNGTTLVRHSTQSVEFWSVPDAYNNLQVVMKPESIVEVILNNGSNKSGNKRGVSTKKIVYVA